MKGWEMKLGCQGASWGKGGTWRTLQLAGQCSQREEERWEDPRSFGGAMTWLADGADVGDKGEGGISMVSRFYWESLGEWWCCQTHEVCHLGWSTQQQNTVVIQVVLFICNKWRRQGIHIWSPIFPKGDWPLLMLHVGILHVDFFGILHVDFFFAVGYT